MRCVPARHPLVVLASVVCGFAAGPALGSLVAHHVAPGSELAQTVSPLAFALAFVAGVLFWFGIGVVAVVAGFAGRLLRGRWREGPPAGAEIVPPGHAAFLPAALGLGLLAGAVAGLSPQAASFWSACAAHAVAGAGYGAALRALARSGYLPFPEPE